MIPVRATQAVDPDAARREAQHILSDGRFRSSSTPRPLRSPLHWLGDRINSAFAAIGRVLGSVSNLIWLAAAVAVIAVVVWAVVRARRRRVAGVPTVASLRRAPESDEDPDALERAADEAERDGDLARAVRLRFRAGLLRLGGRGVIRYRPSVTTGEVRRALASTRFDDLAGTFEAVAYGGKSADRPDVDAARREWPQVLEESGRR